MGCAAAVVLSTRENTVLWRGADCTVAPGMSQAEFKALYRTLDHQGLPDDIDAELQAYQCMGDGKLSMEEFCVAVLKLAKR